MKRLSRWFLYTIASFMFLFPGCRKSSKENIDGYLNVDGQPEVIKQLAAHLRLQENTEPFLTDLIETEGDILWSEHEIQSSTTELSILVPMVIRGTKFVNSFLLFRSNDQGRIFKLIRGKTYDSYGFDFGPRITANTIVSDLLLLNNKVFGDTLFRISDDRLFGLRETKMFHPPFLLSYHPKNNSSRIVSSNALLPSFPGPPGCNRSIVTNGCVIISDSGPSNCSSGTVTFVTTPTCQNPPPGPGTPTTSGGSSYAPGTSGGNSLGLDYNFPPFPVGMSQQQCELRQVPAKLYLTFAAIQARSNETESTNQSRTEIEAWNINSPYGPTYQPIPRPNFITFTNVYPKNSAGTDDMPVSELATLIGGTVLQKYNSGQMKNGCAIRVSRALNYSGVLIPAIAGETWQGADNKNTFIGLLS